VGPHAAKYLAPAVAWALGLALALLSLRVPEPAHRVEYLRISNSRQMPLWIVVYSPGPLPASCAPAAIICEPFNSPAECSRLLALELVKSGFTVLTFDWHGRGPQENRGLLRSAVMGAARADVAAAAAYLRALPQVDPDRIAITGHSVGGTLAIEAAAEDPRMVAVASIGMEADVTPDRPHNLLWAVGLYDEFRVLNRMRDVFQASAASAAMEGVTVGDFRRGTARRLAVSPTADHFTELQDRGIHREVVKWFREAAGLPETPSGLRMETQTALWLLAWLSTLVAALLTVRVVAGGNRWLLRAVVGGALLGVILLGRTRGGHYWLAAAGIEWLLLLTLCGGFLSTRHPEALRQGARLAVKVGLVVWASLLLTLMVNNLSYYWQHPVYFLVFPEFAIRHALDGLYVYLLIYPSPFLFSICSPEAIVLRAWVYILMAVELLSPSILLGALARLARRPVSAPSVAVRDSVGHRRPAGGAKRRWVSVAVLLVLLGVLAGVSWMRLEQGFLTRESLWAAVRYLARFCVLPILIFTLLWRWLARRRAAPESA
jgi:alpha/beta superfamily hydrolase